MTKISRKPLPRDFGQYVNNLWSAFTLLDSKADIRSLFRDLFTHTEYKMFAKRLEIARRLLQQSTYESIRKELVVTDGTTNSVSKVLAERGDGYRKVHTKLSAMEEKLRKVEKQKLDRIRSPFKVRAKRMPALAKALKFGIVEGSKEIHRRKKLRSATKTFDI